MSDGNTESMSSTGPRWYVAYTYPRHEKRVARHLTAQSIDNFLPLYRSISRWADRTVETDRALFPGYVFVRLPYREHLSVLQTPSIAGLVSFGGKPASLDEQDIASLRRGLEGGGMAKPFPFLKVGQKVRVKTGPFAGITGILKRRNGQFRLVVSLLQITQSVLLDINGAEVEPC